MNSFIITCLVTLCSLGATSLSLSAQNDPFKQMQFAFDLIQEMETHVKPENKGKVKQAYQDFITLFGEDLQGDLDNELRSKAFQALAKLEESGNTPSPEPPALPAVSQVEADKETAEKTDDDVFLVVENPPKMLGGAGSLYKYLVYPEAARRAGVEGRVFVQFVVDKNGRTRDHKVIRSIGGGCDEAAVDAIKKTKWEPGTQRGKPVNVQFSIPVMFKLSE